MCSQDTAGFFDFCSIYIFFADIFPKDLSTNFRLYANQEGITVIGPTKINEKQASKRQILYNSESKLLKKRKINTNKNSKSDAIVFKIVVVTKIISSSISFSDNFF